jgi:hypothetical protein
MRNKSNSQYVMYNIHSLKNRASNTINIITHINLSNNNARFGKPAFGRGVEPMFSHAFTHSPRDGVRRYFGFHGATYHRF